MENVECHPVSDVLERAFRQQLHASVFLIGEARDAEAIRLVEQRSWRQHRRELPATAPVGGASHEVPLS